MESLGSVLLVDDEETFRESTCRLLQREGYDCLCASNGDEAVTSLRNRWFDVMVTDIRMPANPDLRVVRAAKEIDGHLPVVVVTGYPSTETAIRGIDLAVSAYLVKPLDFDKLLGQLKLAVAHSRSRRVLAAVREQLQTCLADLDAASGSAATTGREVTVTIGTIRTLAASLSELLRLSARSEVGEPSGNLCELLDCPQKPAHRQAIVESIEVLKQTKDAFKSKALAELRMKLERLLAPGEAGRGPR